MRWAQGAAKQPHRPGVASGSRSQGDPSAGSKVLLPPPESAAWAPWGPGGLREPSSAVATPQGGPGTQSEVPDVWRSPGTHVAEQRPGRWKRGGEGGGPGKAFTGARTDLHGARGRGCPSISCLPLRAWVGRTLKLPEAVRCSVRVLVPPRRSRGRRVKAKPKALVGQTRSSSSRPQRRGPVT